MHVDGPVYVPHKEEENGNNRVSYCYDVKFYSINRDRYFCCVTFNLSKLPSSVFIMDRKKFRNKRDIRELKYTNIILLYEGNKITIYIIHIWIQCERNIYFSFNDCVLFFAS